MAIGFAARRQYSAIALLIPAVQAAREGARRLPPAGGASSAYDLGTGAVETLVSRITNWGIPGPGQTTLVMSATESASGAGRLFIPDVGDEVLVAFEHGSTGVSRALGPDATISFVGCGLTPSRVGSAPVSELARRLGVVINCAEPDIGDGYRYDSTGAGRRLLGHELTHIVQQAGGSDSSGVTVHGWNAVAKKEIIGPARGG